MPPGLTGIANNITKNFEPDKILISNIEGQCIGIYTILDSTGKIYIFDELLENQIP